MRLHAIMEVTVKESGDTMPQVVVVNAEKMNFDGKLDFSVLSDSVAVYPSSTPEKLLQRIQGAQVVVTKKNCPYQQPCWSSFHAACSCL